jgi:hypothetical protein
MSKRLAIVTPILAIAAFAVTPVAAQAAEPLWRSNGAVIKEGKKRQTISFGVMKFKSPIGEVVCKWADAHEIENPFGGGHGLDIVTLWTTYECSSAGCPGRVIVTGQNVFKWLTFLRRFEERIQDVWTGVEMRVQCLVGEKEESVLNTVFKGELSPTLTNGTSAAKPAFEEFGPGSGSLVSEEFGAGELTGKDKMMGFEEQEVIQAQ